MGFLEKQGGLLACWVSLFCLFFKDVINVEKGSFQTFDLDAGIDSHLLLLGLMYREISRLIETEPEVATTAPPHLVHSSFGIKELKQIEAVIKGIPLPSKR